MSNSEIFKKDLEMQFTDESDEELVMKANQGNEYAIEYLMEKYRKFIKMKAKSYFLVGADKEDVYQEGMIGLYKAIRDYRQDKTASFKSFADLCVTRQMITAVKTSTRQKHIPLNSYISLNKHMYDEESHKTLEELVSTRMNTNPEELIIGNEEINTIENKIQNTLSKLELEVLLRHINGESYQEIASDLDKEAKSIDNALQRVKRKLEKSLVKR
ncbi:MAG: RNA polymerase sporulation sigma factor SigH [Clostridium sp.]